MKIKKYFLGLFIMTHISLIYSQVNLMPGQSDQSQRLSSIDIVELRNKFKSAFKRRQFDQAYSLLSQLSDDQRTATDLSFFKFFILFDDIEKEQKNYDGMFKKDDSMSVESKKMIKRLIREGKYCLYTGQKDIAKDIFMQVLYVDKANYFVRQLFDQEWQMSPGSYVIRNMEAKYWKQSEISFYSGQFQDAIHALTVLTFFDSKNATVYERLGSNYYNSGQTQDAIDAWTTAYVLNPKQVDLETYIKNAKTFLKEQKIAFKALMDKEKRKKKKKSDVVEKDMVLMGVYVKQTAAYAFSEDVKKELGIQPVVEETDDGNWAVKIPKSAQKKAPEKGKAVSK